jgi:hypothetical protein
MLKIHVLCFARIRIKVVELAGRIRFGIGQGKRLQGLAFVVVSARTLVIEILPFSPPDRQSQGVGLLDKVFADATASAGVVTRGEARTRTGQVRPSGLVYMLKAWTDSLFQRRASANSRIWSEDVVLA